MCRPRVYSLCQFEVGCMSTAWSEVVVLLVGEHDSGLEVLLRQAGLCVLTATTGDEALDLSRRFVDNLVLVIDIDIGEMSGSELYRQIREHRPETPVIFIADT